MNEDTASKPLRRQFLIHLLGGLQVVWPILAAITGLMMALGCAIALIEDWSLFEGVYFAFVSGLTIGYGDFAPEAPLARVLAIAIGFTGTVLTGLVAAVAVQALYATLQAQSPPKNT